VSPDRWSGTAPGFEFEGGQSGPQHAIPPSHGPYTGDPYRERPLADDPYADGVYRDNPYADGPYRDDPHADGPYRDDPYAGQPYRDGPYADGPYRGQPHTSQPYADDPYRDGPYRDEPYSDGPYRDEPYSAGPPAGGRPVLGPARGRVLRAEPDGDSQTFRYTPVVSQPMPVSPPAWDQPGWHHPAPREPLRQHQTQHQQAQHQQAQHQQTQHQQTQQQPAEDTPLPMGGFGFDDQGWFVPPPGTGPFGAIDDSSEPAARRPSSANAERTPAGRARARSAHTRPVRTRAGWSPAAADYGARPGGRGAEPESRDAYTEWAGLLGSFVPEPIKRRWSSEFRAGLHFRGWGLRVAIPILATVIFGVALVAVRGSGGNSAGPAPSASSLGYPPATLAGGDFTTASSDRGIDQSLGAVASDGNEIVAVGSQTGGRLARAQFFVSENGGKTWTLGAVRSASGGPPLPGHAATFVAGGNGAWLALGPGSIWTSPDGRTWTLAPGNGLPLRAGDRISAVKRTAAGYIAVGENVPGGLTAKSTPVVFLSSDGSTWRRLDAAQLHLAAGSGRVLDLRSAAASGNQILISGDIVTTTSTGKPARATTVQQGGAWLSRDGGSSWMPALKSAAAPAGHGATGQITAVAAAGQGFVLFRPATAGGNPAVDVYTSGGSTTWTFATTLGTAIGFTPSVADGGPGGAVITGRAGSQLTAFASANGRAWQQAGPFAASAAETVSGATLAGGTVVTAGTGQPQPGSRQPLITMVAPGRTAASANLTGIPGATDQQVAANALAARGSTQVAVGSANGYPAAWTSANGGGTWTRATGATSAVLGRPGSQQLTSVTGGTAGWLAVGGVTSGATQHPVVVTSADGGSWQAADTEPAFAAPGLFTEQAAAAPAVSASAGRAGYVIVGYQQTGTGANAHTIAAAWWSNGLTGWQRAGDAAPGALDGAGASRQMLAVTSAANGFVAVGSHGRQPSVWTTGDGRTWQQADLPVPAGATQAVLQHVAGSGQAVTAIGTATTASGQQPFAASSANGGRTWTETNLPQPQGPATATALTATGHGFVVTGVYGASPAHQDVLVWASPNGVAWTTALPAGRGFTGSGVQAITGLTASGSTLSGVGYTATPTTEAPTFWQSPIR